MELKNILDLFVYLVPGFIALQVYHLAHPEKERHAVFIGSLSAVIGVGINLFLKELDKNLFGNAFQTISIETTKLVIPSTNAVQIPPLPTFPFYIALVTSGLFVGFVWAASKTFRTWLGKKIINNTDKNKLFKFINTYFPSVLPDSKTIWNRINDTNTTKWAYVYLSDDTIYQGVISHFSDNPDITDQDFWLEKAQRLKCEDLTPAYPINGGVYFNLKNVSRVEFYQGVSTDESTTNEEENGNLLPLNGKYLSESEQPHIESRWWRPS